MKSGRRRFAIYNKLPFRLRVRHRWFKSDYQSFKRKEGDTTSLRFIYATINYTSCAPRVDGRRSRLVRQGAAILEFFLVAGLSVNRKS
jgi:chorismate-pyruvate lyase